MTDKTYQIRAFEPGDGDALAAIYQGAVDQIARVDYSEIQRAAWLSIAPTGDIMETAYGDGRLALVAVDHDARVIGFSDLEEDGHIQFLYVDPGAAGRGVGSSLIRALEGAARQRGLGRLYSEASETALPVFLKQGFERLHRRDLKIGDVDIHNYSVEKRL
jgi:putative acetyltransferase